MVVGSVVTLLSCRVRGYTNFGVVDLVWGERANFLWLGLLDAAGATTAVIFFWVLVPARSDTLLNFVKDYPYLFWPGLGAIGPLVAAGLLRRTPAAVTVPAPGRPGEKAGLYEIRRAISREIYDTAEHLSRLWRITRNDWVFVIAKKRHADGSLSFDELREFVESRHRRQRRRFPLPRHWKRLIDERATWVTEQDPSDCTLRLAQAALRAGFVSEVAQACRIKLTEFRFDAVYQAPGQEMVALQSGSPVAGIEQLGAFEELEADPQEL
jgi:hypothetical protein